MSSVEIEGLNETLKRLDIKNASRPVTTFFRKAARFVMVALQRIAPRWSGRMYGTWNAKFDRNVPPRWARVGSNATNKGWKYPAALNASGRFHYRAGGGSTVGWVNKGKRSAEGPIRGLLNWLGRQIAQSMGGP